MIDCSKISWAYIKYCNGRYIVEKVKKSGFWLAITKGAIVALGVAMVSILAFAFIVKWASLDENVINVVNQVIKIVAIFFGVVACLKVNSEKHLYKGMIVGALFAVLSFLLFSALNKSFNFDLTFVWDVVFATAIGLICAIVVNILRK